MALETRWLFINEYVDSCEFRRVSQKGSYVIKFLLLSSVKKCGYYLSWAKFMLYEVKFLSP